MRCLLPLLLLWPAAASADLDAWLGALQPVDTKVVVVPRLGTLSAPIDAAFARFEAHPALTEWARAARAAAAEGELLFVSPGAAGLDPEGAFFAAQGDAGGVAAVPIADLKAFEGHLQRTANLSMVSATVAGRPGFRLGAAVAAQRGRHLWIGDSEASLRRFLEAAPRSGDPLAGCPRAKGEADLFLLLRGPAARELPEALRRGCVTLRVDPDRVRLDARLAPGVPLDRWLQQGPPRLLPRLAARPTAALEVRLGIKGRTALRRRLEADAPAGARDLFNAFDGAFGFAVGPGPLEVELVAGVRDAAVARKALGALVANSARAEVTPTPTGWAVRVPTPDAWPDSVPKLEEARLVVDGGVVRATTLKAAPAKLDLRAGAGEGRLNMDVFERAAALLYLRGAGAPHDGSRWADALAEVTRLLGLPAAELRRITSAAAFLLAHFGELGLGVRPTAAGLEVALEVVLL